MKEKINKFWKFVNEAEGNTAELLIYGAIASQKPWYSDDDDSVYPTQFRNDLKACGGKNLTVRINSGGGDVFAAQTIYTLLKGYTGDVTVHIDGMCASAATLIACAGDKIVMPRNALYMIHNPKTFAFGDFGADYMRQTADILDTVKQTIVNVYVSKCNGELTAEEIGHMMDDETWMTADEAEAYGFIDEIDDYIVTAEIRNNMLFMNDIAYHGHGDIQKICEMIGEKKHMKNNDLVAKIANVLGISPAEPAVQENQAEKQRIAGLEALKTDNVYGNAVIDQAIKEGKTASDVKSFIDAVNAVEAPKNEASEALDSIRALIEDQMRSGSQEVKPSPKAGMGMSKENQKMQDINDVVTAANKMRGVK